MRYNVLISVILLLTLLPGVAIRCQGISSNSSFDISYLRDSLDSFQLIVPTIPSSGKYEVITIRTQKEWENLYEILKSELKKGIRNIEIRVAGKENVLSVKKNTITNLNYPDANIRIVSSNARMMPEGIEFRNGDTHTRIENNFWLLPYHDFDINDMFVDENGKEVSLCGKVLEQENEIIKVKDDIWKMKVELADLSEQDCKDFYVLLTQDWTSARHRVVKVVNNWLYFNLDSDDNHLMCNPNIDRVKYGVNPRYQFINNPVSNGLHIKNNNIYIPRKYYKIRANKGGVLIHMGSCKFNSFEICGFNLSGLKECPIGIYHSTFIRGLFVHHNDFRHLSSLAINSAWSENVIFCDNNISYSRSNVIECGGKNTTICRNRLKKIGWITNTHAIVGGGENLHICDNVIEDFNYSAIACGNSKSNEKAGRLTYIIERNVIRLNKEYTDDYLKNTLADGGGIYIGPQCTSGIIRNNVIDNIKGIHSNRGIFLDDGAKNLAIYGNYVSNTANSYDIDLRYSKSYEAGIPDHNTNNYIFHNIMTGGYRFEDAGSNSQCMGGKNLLLGIGPFQKTQVDLTRYVNDNEIKGCKIKKGRIAIPQQHINLLDSICVDDFVRKYFYRR